MLRELIVNADDCNLTDGVTRGILECREKGIVSSTTWMVNRPTNSEMVSRVAKSGLGVGIHLNVTSGKPLSSAGDILSLIDERRMFKKKDDYLKFPPKPADLLREYKKQIKLFEKHFGRPPTHLDTHHQMHDDPVFLQVLLQIAREQKLPVRRSRLMKGTPQLSPVREAMLNYSDIKTTNVLLGDLGAHVFWTVEKLEKCLSELLPGKAEIMCHPGIWDEELQSLTSMTVTREKEHALFSSPHLKKILERHKIRLIHFGELA